MRAVRLREFGPPRVMRWEDVPAPERGPGEVSVAVEAFGVNFADTMVRRGEYRRDQPLSFTPGFEVVGRVLEGPSEGPAPGTAVAGEDADAGAGRRPLGRPLQNPPHHLETRREAQRLVAAVLAPPHHRVGEVHPERLD